MKPLVRIHVDPLTVEEMKRRFGHKFPGYTDEQWQHEAAVSAMTEHWANDTYHVQVHRHEGLAHLSIKRHDREVVSSESRWRDFQAMKNQIIGPECEGVELYPAESRLVDTSNQYHLWVVSEPGFRFPFGFGDRLVFDGTGELDEQSNTKQNPLS